MAYVKDTIVNTTNGDHHVAFSGSTGAGDDVIVDAGTTKRVFPKMIQISAVTAAVGTVSIGLAASGVILMRFNLVASGNIVMYFVDWPVAAAGQDLVIDTTTGTVDGSASYALRNP